MPSHQLPIFPLGTVLLPGAALPLRLFEPRYLQLAQDLAALPEDERSFGVLRIGRGHEVGAGAAAETAAVGCEARVESMSLADGPHPVVLLVACGARRFRVESMLPDSVAPYAVAHVTWLPERSVRAGAGASEADAERAAARAAMRTFAAYRSAIGASAVDIQATVGELAYRLSEHVMLDGRDVQRLLECEVRSATGEVCAGGAADRLDLLTRLMRREMALVRTFGSVPRRF